MLAVAFNSIKCRSLGAAGLHKALEKKIWN